MLISPTQLSSVPLVKTYTLTGGTFSPPTWESISCMGVQWPVPSGDANFSVGFIPPENYQYCLAIRWTDVDGNTVRFKLTAPGGEVLHYPLYAAETVGADAYIELWTTEYTPESLELDDLIMTVGIYEEPASAQNLPQSNAATLAPETDFDPTCDVFCNDEEVDPTTIAGAEALQQWADATQEGYANGAAVATVNDYSGNNRDWTQATGGFQPLFDSATEAFPYFTADGSDDFVSSGNVVNLGTDDWTFAVVTKITAPPDLTEAGIWTKGLFWGSATGDWGTYAVGDAPAFVSAFAIDDGTTITSTLSAAQDGNWHLLVARIRRSAGTVELFIDGALVASASGLDPAAMTNVKENVLFAATDNAGTGFDFFLDGSIAEACAWNVALSDAQLASLNTNYFGPKYPVISF